MVLIRESHIPLYHQIANDIERLIKEKHYEVGSKIPGEHALMDKYEVSRLTVRNAINLLVERDLIVAKQGKGMFVKSSPIEVDTNVHNFRGFYEGLLDQGIDVKVTLYKYEKVLPSKKIAEQLECSTSDEVYVFHRLFEVRDLPIAVLVGYLNPKIIPTPEQIKKLKQEAILALLRNELGLNVIEVRYAMEVKHSPKEISEKLKITPNTPILYANRTTICDNNLPFTTTFMYLCTDYYQFKFNIKKH